MVCDFCMMPRVALRSLLQELTGICTTLAQVLVLARDRRRVCTGRRYDIEAFAQRLSQFLKSVSKYWPITRQLKVDVRQQLRIDNRVSAIFVTCNCFKTILGQNLETKIHKRNFVAKRSVKDGCTEPLATNLSEAAI